MSNRSSSGCCCSRRQFVLPGRADNTSRSRTEAYPTGRWRNSSCRCCWRSSRSRWWYSPSNEGCHCSTHRCARPDRWGNTSRLNRDRSQPGIGFHQILQCRSRLCRSSRWSCSPWSGGCCCNTRRCVPPGPADNTSQQGRRGSQRGTGYRRSRQRPNRLCCSCHWSCSPWGGDCYCSTRRFSHPGRGGSTSRRSRRTFPMGTGCLQSHRRRSRQCCSFRWTCSPESVGCCCSRRRYDRPGRGDSTNPQRTRAFRTGSSGRSPPKGERARGAARSGVARAALRARCRWRRRAFDRSTGCSVRADRSTWWWR